jgi:RNA polymerase sigma-70 factor (ECF subfamily)
MQCKAHGTQRPRHIASTVQRRNAPPQALLQDFLYYKVNKLSSPAELSLFLSSVERRAFKQASFAVHDTHTALDIVQDAMLKLAEKYGGKPAEEFPMLFQRILQNTIRDHYRRQSVRNAWTSLFSSLQPKHQEEEFDPLDVLEDDDNQSTPAAPHASFQQKQLISLIEEALVNLPPWAARKAA